MNEIYFAIVVGCDYCDYGFFTVQKLWYRVGKLFPMDKSFGTMSGNFFRCAMASAPRREAFSDAQKLQHHGRNVLRRRKGIGTECATKNKNFEY